MSRILCLLVLSAALAAGASAQSIQRVKNPFRLELGVYVPAAEHGVDTSAGGAAGLEYAFARTKDIEFGVALRSNFFHASSHGMGGDISLSSALITGSFHPRGSKFFGGVGFGAGQTDVRAGSVKLTSDPEFTYSIDAGMDIAPHTYLLARYQGADQRGQRGLTFGVGFRF